MKPKSLQLLLHPHGSLYITTAQPIKYFSSGIAVACKVRSETRRALQYFKDEKKQTNKGKTKTQTQFLNQFRKQYISTFANHFWKQSWSVGWIPADGLSQSQETTGGFLQVRSRQFWKSRVWDTEGLELRSTAASAWAANHPGKNLIKGNIPQHPHFDDGRSYQNKCLPNISSHP